MSTDKTIHTVDTGLDSTLGEDKYLPWSCSRVETALTCLHKFKIVYLDGEKESTNSLVLGSLTHLIMADLLHLPEPDFSTFEDLVSKYYPKFSVKDPKGIIKDELLSFGYYMLDFAYKWQNFLTDHGITKFRTERQYGVTRLFGRSSFTPIGTRETFLRSAIDLWAYDKNTQTLYVVDHKTNKSASSSHKVKENIQLNLYAVMLQAIYKMPVKQTYIALNFIRRKKIVWAKLTPYEVWHFMMLYNNTLRYLENKLYECDSSLVWPATPSYKCQWCTFKDSCPAR